MTRRHKLKSHKISAPAAKVAAKNSTNSSKVADVNAIHNPSKLAIQVQAIYYLLEERVGMQLSMKELDNLCLGFHTEKERLIFIDKKHQGALPAKKNTTAKPAAAKPASFLEVTEKVSFESLLDEFTKNTPAPVQTYPKNAKAKGMLFIQSMLKEFADNTVTRTRGPAAAPAKPAAEAVKPAAVETENPCKYTMTPAVKKKIEDMSKVTIKKIIDIYRLWSKLTVPQTLFVRMQLLKPSLENLETQNVNLVSMFTQNLCKNMQPDAEDASP